MNITISFLIGCMVGMCLMASFPAQDVPKHVAEEAVKVAYAQGQYDVILEVVEK